MAQEEKNGLEVKNNPTVYVVIAVFVTLLIIGGIAYEAYQQKKDSFIEQEGQLRQEMANLQDKTSVLEQEKTSFFAQVEDLKKQLVELTEKLTAEPKIDFCTASATVSAVGIEEYPINSELYTDNGVLGQLFTASDCNATRTAMVYGAKDDTYTLKPDLTLKEKPNMELVKVLKGIGFKEGKDCAVNKPEECTTWKLNLIVPLPEILKLKPYGDLIASSTCTNCK